jgi:biopolymer transport protein ExbB
MNTQTSLIEMFRLGGIFMWPLLAFAIATAAIIIERIIYIFYHNLKVSSLSTRTQQLIADNRMDDALSYLQSQPRKNTAASVLLVLLKNARFGESRMERAAEGEAQERIRRLENGFNYLTSLSSIAPLTGFLGTVSGMIGAFRSIAEATDVNAQLVANGIYEALVTTVFGLVIAITALVAYNLLAQRVDFFAAEITKAVNDLVPEILDYRSRNTGSGETAV